MIGNPTLEAAICANRDDPAPYLVYADWLQSHGSPIGELIVLSHALESADDPAKRTRAEAIVAGLELPEPNMATFGWHRGLLRWLRLENSKDWMDDKFDALALAARVFGSPACNVLEELRIGILRWESNYNDVPAVLAEAARHPWAAGLTRLHLGDVDGDIDMAHHVIGDVGARISQSFPQLAWLKLHSGEQSWSTKTETFGLAGLALPALAELVVETCALSQQRCRDLLAADLPNLARLELWFGGTEYPGDPPALADLEPLLATTAFPQLRHLALRNATLADDFARTVPTSAIARSLESFDLSMGTLGDDAAVALAGMADALPALRTLDVHDNFLTERGIAALTAAFPFATVVTGEQKTADGDYRYVSVAE
jgi:uncharacterized protein (TIGR02996 family)